MSQSKTLLIVDDSRVSRMMIKSFAKAAVGDLEVIEAGSGEEALQQVASDRSNDY